MLIARFVVFRRPPHQPLGQRLAVKLPRKAPRIDLLNQAKQSPPVAIGHLKQCLTRMAIKRQRTSQLLLGALCKLLKISQPQALQNQNLRPRQQSRIQLKARVFGCRTDKQDRTVLHEGQKAVLLGFVEAMDFIHKQKRSLSVGVPVLGRLKDFLQVRDTREDCADLDKMQISFIRQEPRNRRLAHTRRPPKDKRGQRA